mgnify:CR=1 FL=1
MKLFEVKNDIVTINIDANIIRKFNVNKTKSKIDYGDCNEVLIDKLKNGNQDAIIKAIGIIKKTLVKSGCSTYEQLYKRGVK